MKLRRTLLLGASMIGLASCGGGSSTAPVPEEYRKVAAAYKEIVAQHADGQVITVHANPEICYLAYRGDMYISPDKLSFTAGYISYYGNKAGYGTESFSGGNVAFVYQATSIEICVSNVTFYSEQWGVVHTGAGNVTYFFNIENHQVGELDHYVPLGEPEEMKEEILTWIGSEKVRFAVSRVVSFLNENLQKKLGLYYF